MKALILAAGLGSRLESLTADNQKALLEVNGSPILPYQLDGLLANNIKEIGIVIGCQGRKIMDFVQSSYSALSVRYWWDPEFSYSNSSYSSWLAREWIAGET